MCPHVEIFFHHLAIASLKTHDQTRKHLGFSLLLSSEVLHFMLQLDQRFSLIVVNGMNLMSRLKFYAYCSRERSPSPSRCEAWWWVWWQGQPGAHERTTVHSLWLLKPHSHAPGTYLFSKATLPSPTPDWRLRIQIPKTISFKPSQKCYCIFDFCFQLLVAYI